MVDRSALVASKLKALVDGRWGPDPARTRASVPGAAILADDRSVWALFDQEPGANKGSTGLGPVLAWSTKQGRDISHLLADETDDVARQVCGLKRRPEVWRINGRDLVEASTPPTITRSGVSEAVTLRAPVLVDVGLDVTFEHGLALGEYRGLEVARVVPVDGGAQVEIGIGEADRHVQEMMADLHPELERLRGVAALARKHRADGAALHPLSRLMRERWLRADLIADPAPLGLAFLESVEPISARTSIASTAPAAAIGQRPDGTGVVVVCSVGVDLGLVPFAADIWLREAEALGGPTTPLILVMPERDRLPITVRMADALLASTSIVSVEGSWRD